MAFRIRFAASAVGHLDGSTARERPIVLDAIERQLAHEPLVQTRNRKTLRPNLLAPCELRVRSFRVFYEVVSTEPDVVNVLAIGRKLRNALRIGAVEITL